jgi:hypothetical protein
MLEFRAGKDGTTATRPCAALLKKEFRDGFQQFVNGIANPIENSHIGHEEKNNPGSGEPAEINCSSKRKPRMSHTKGPLQDAPCSERKMRDAKRSWEAAYGELVYKEVHNAATKFSDFSLSLGSRPMSASF